MKLHTKLHDDVLVFRLTYILLKFQPALSFALEINTYGDGQLSYKLLPHAPY